MFGNLKLMRKIGREFDRRAADWAKRTGRSKWEYTETLRLPAGSVSGLAATMAEAAVRFWNERVAEAIEGAKHA